MTENNKVIEAAREYLNRQSRLHHPDGKTDGIRWYPSENEHCDCCDKIRNPSRAYPWSLMTHCRTARHIANLYEVDYKEMMKTVKEIKQCQQMKSIMKQG